MKTSEARPRSVAQFLDDAGRQRWGMGATPGMDCCKLMAGWMIENGWPDPMADYRAIYQGPAVARRLILRAGGLVALVGHRMAELGAPAIERPQAGDIGIIARATDDGFHQAGALCLGAVWGSLTGRGVLIGPAEVLGAWRVA